MSIKKTIINTLRNSIVQRKIAQERAHEEFLDLKHVPEAFHSALDEAEQGRVKALWGAITPNISFKEYEVYKHVRGFDERFLSHELYLPLVAHALNDYHYTKFFEDKGLLGNICKGGLNYPYCVVRYINGDCYDNDMHQISKAEANARCHQEGLLIVKPSADGYGGHGVKKFNGGEHAQLIEEVEQMGYKKFVVQRCIKQHAVMAQFNDSSLNTFRIETLYLNGKATCHSIILRVGPKGSLVDNLAAGGIGVGVDMDGSLADVGYTLSLEKLDTFNGVVLKGKKFDFMPQLVAEILQAHQDTYPLCKFIGWDVCIDEEQGPVIIELNSSQPGIFVEQMCTGPIFGDRTEEVIEYCKNRAFVYNRSLFSY